MIKFSIEISNRYMTFKIASDFFAEFAFQESLVRLCGVVDAMFLKRIPDLFRLCLPPSYRARAITVNHHVKSCRFEE